MRPAGSHNHDSVMRTLTDQRGMALITVLLLIVIMTVIGITAITITGMEGRMAGFMRTGEAATAAAESCLDTGMQVILQTLDIDAGGQLPLAFGSSSGGPVPDVPVANLTSVQNEILGSDDNNPDPPLPTLPNLPDLSMNINNYGANGDIDRLYIQPKPGTTQAFDEPASGSIEILYRVDCQATNTATGSSSRVIGIYACTLNADGCQRAL